MKKNLKRNKYTHVEMQERFESLERKKEELRKKREAFEPIRMKDLLEHERSYK